MLSRLPATPLLNYENISNATLLSDQSGPDAPTAHRGEPDV
jgi:hypothetical protein